MKKIIIYLIGLVCFIPMTAFGVSITLENPGAILFMVGDCPGFYMDIENPWLYWTNNAGITSGYKKVGEIDGCLWTNDTDVDSYIIATAIPICAKKTVAAGVQFFNDSDGIYEFAYTCPQDIVPPGTNNGYYKLGSKCVSVGYFTFKSCNNGKTTGNRDWSASCASSVMNSNTMKVMGVAACSDTKPNNMTPGGGVLMDDGALHFGTPYCYCKVISPYESKWVFGAEYPASNPADNNCNDSCAGFCAYAIQNEAAFRTAISSESNIVK